MCVFPRTRTQKFDPTSIILDDPELWRDRLNRYHIRNVDLRKTDRYIMIAGDLALVKILQHPEQKFTYASHSLAPC